MFTAYSTGPEDGLHGTGTDNVRRRSTNFRRLSLTRRRTPAGDHKEDTDSTTNVAANPSSLSISRRPSSLLSASRRKLPWLDGRISSDREGHQRHRHVPGEFESDDETSWSPIDNKAQPSLTRPESPLPNPSLDLHVPNRSSSLVYTPSIYSTDAVSRKSLDPPVQSLRPHRSYGALLSPPTEPTNTAPETRNKTPSHHARRPDSLVGGSATSTPKLQPPLILKQVSPVPIMPDEPRVSSVESAQPLQPTPAETGLQKTISGTENLVQKVIDAAKDAVDHHMSNGVSKVLEGAARSLEKSPTPASKMEPLQVSDSLDTSPDETPTDLETSFSPKTSHSPHAAALPTQSSAEDAYPFYQRKSADSIVTDWAYVKAKTPARVQSPSPSSSSTSTSTSPDVQRQQSTHWRAWHNNTKRPVYHDDHRYVDRHVRSIGSPPTKKEVHDHIKRHGNPPTPLRDSSLRHRNVDIPAHQHFQRFRPSDSTRQVRDRRKERRSGEPRRRKPPQPWDDLNPESSKGFEMGQPARTHVSYRGAEGLDVFQRQRREPIARNWGTSKKRITATVACINTALVGFLIGVYAGEVPRIQYAIADQGHWAILGNVFLYLGLAISTFFSWPLPLLHGRKPYVLGSLAILLPLQFPQALVVGTPRDPETHLYRVGLLLPRAISGLVLGFAHVNFVATLLDLFGASLQSANPHEELVFPNDARRHGGGMGLWLGIWAWSFLASIAVGFMVGAVLINSVDPSWGFYIVVILIASVLILNVLTPETRKARFRRSAIELIDPNSEYVYQRIVRGEVKLHISPDGPDWWGQEVAAGIWLSMQMFFQLGFGVLATYIAWIYAQFVLIIVLLGALLSRDYRWHPQHVGAGVTSLAVGALLAIPLTKAGLLSRDRTHGPRTDSMTFQPQMTWTSHMTRRIIFTTFLPLAGLAYTLASCGPTRGAPAALPILFAALAGFLSALAWAETHGLAMEAFDTCDLQPGANSRHRLQSMADVDRRRRTAYSAFPRVTAAFAAAHALAFLLAAAATGVGGALTRRFGAQTSTGVVAAVLGALTLALTGVLWRWARVVVIPDGVFGDHARVHVGGGKGEGEEGEVGGGGGEESAWRAAVQRQSGGAAGGARADVDAEKFAGEFGTRPADWKPVIIGNPSGRVRRVNVLELGRWSRWSEIRRLNGLLPEK
ncbi:polyamine transport protein [Diplodia corticola]|uniref:Polyamine transport protein n=1 Tax=Diplodia corticola TaxID=236234 RepID=A0A1J9R446_9PEZI|nr:polyamine transport protein [Diplodia corticola]OJD35353.1 polyamine transport protein [Diplodia corticola]